MVLLRRGRTFCTITYPSAINSFVKNSVCAGQGFAYRTDTEETLNWILENADYTYGDGTTVVAYDGTTRTITAAHNPASGGLEQPTPARQAMVRARRSLGQAFRNVSWLSATRRITGGASGDVGDVTFAPIGRRKDAPRNRANSRSMAAAWCRGTLRRTCLRVRDCAVSRADDDKR